MNNPNPPFLAMLVVKTTHTIHTRIQANDTIFIIFRSHESSRGTLQENEPQVAVQSSAQGWSYNT